MEQRWVLRWCVVSSISECVCARNDSSAAPVREALMLENGSGVNERVKRWAVGAVSVVNSSFMRRSVRERNKRHKRRAKNCG